MADYIDRKAAIARFKEYALNVFGINIDIPEEYGGHSFGENFWEGLHGAIDVVPVVRCRECRYYNKPRLGWCSAHLDREGPNDFCSYSEREEDTP